LYNIVTGQCHRFLRANSSQNGFLHSATDLYAKFIDKGYQRSKLDQKFELFIRLHSSELHMRHNAVSMRYDYIKGQQTSYKREHSSLHGSRSVKRNKSSDLDNITATPPNPPTKEDIQIKRQKAMWKKDDMNHAREFRIHTERQCCNALFWESSFVPQVQLTAEQQAQHTAMIEEEYLQHQIKNAPRRKQTTSQQEFEDWQFQEKQAYLQQQQQHHQYDNLEPHFHTEEEHQAPVLQFQNNQTSLPHLALENQFQWRI
jgi:hypothetical protein